MSDERIWVSIDEEMKGVILDLCGGTGAWSDPYRNAGYDVVIVDTLYGDDVMNYTPPENVYGVLAAPPCTEFARSGARWWKDKDPELLQNAISVVRACLGIIQTVNPSWWALENPVGRLSRCVPEIGKWSYTYQPYQFGDPWSKLTCIWGEHNQPERGPIVEPDPKKGPWWIGPGPDRQRLRSITPPGFANAFFRANRILSQETENGG